MEAMLKIQTQLGTSNKWEKAVCNFFIVFIEICKNLISENNILYRKTFLTVTDYFQYNL